MVLLCFPSENSIFFGFLSFFPFISIFYLCSGSGYNNVTMINRIIKTIVITVCLYPKTRPEGVCQCLSIPVFRVLPSDELQDHA